MTSVLVTVLLLFGNAFFVASEFALITSRHTVVQPLAETSKRARQALAAMNQLPLMIAGAQLGVTLCSLALGALTEPAAERALEAPFHALGAPPGTTRLVAFVLALALVVFLHTVLGEMVPRNLTLVGPEAVVVWLGPPMLWFCTATKPVLVAMRWAARTVLQLWRIEATETVKTVYSVEELAGLVSQARTEGLLDVEEHARITGALALSERTAGDALRPWSSVTTVTDDVSPASLELLATRTRRSRFPVVERGSRRVLGFVHVKDVLGMSGPARRAPIPASLIRPLALVPPDRKLAEVLLAMRRERRHIVLVSDGRTPLGVVTLDDVLGAVVGGTPEPRSVAG